MAFRELRELREQEPVPPKRKPPYTAAPFRQKTVEKGRIAEQRIVAMRNQKRLQNVNWRLRMALAQKCEDNLQSVLKDVAVLKKDGVMAANDDYLGVLCVSANDMLSTLRHVKVLKKARYVFDRTDCRERVNEALNTGAVWELGETISDALRTQAISKNETRNLLSTFKTRVAHHVEAQTDASTAQSLRAALLDHSKYPNRLSVAIKAAAKNETTATASTPLSSDLIAKSIARRRASDAAARVRVSLRQPLKHVDPVVMARIMGKNPLPPSLEIDSRVRFREAHTVNNLLEYYYWRYSVCNPRSANTGTQRESATETQSEDNENLEDEYITLPTLLKPMRIITSTTSAPSTSRVSMDYAPVLQGKKRNKVVDNSCSVPSTRVPTTCGFSTPISAAISPPYVVCNNFGCSTPIAMPQKQLASRPRSAPGHKTRRRVVGKREDKVSANDDVADRGCSSARPRSQEDNRDINFQRQNVGARNRILSPLRQGWR